MLYEWNSLEDFNTWHNALCLELGYPLTGTNLGTGEPDENAPKTTAYTTPIPVGEKVIAFVEIKYANGLTPTDLEIPRISIE